MQALCKALGITGCDRLLGDLNLLAQILMIVALWIGWYFARRKQILRHRNVQTAVIIANIFFIAFIMLTSFYQYVIAGGSTGGTVAILMMVHGLLGLIAELMGIYLVLRMRTQLIPARFRVKNFKRLMRLTLAFWTIIVLLGFEIYYFRYLVGKVSASELTLYSALLLLGELAGLFLSLQFITLPSAAGTWGARIVLLLAAMLGLFYFNVVANQTPQVASVSETATPLPATPTTAPTATAVLPTARLAPTAVPPRGLLTFANDKGLNDVAKVALSNVPPPPAGKIYQAWFASSNVALLASVGEVKVAPDGTAAVQYTEPKSDNLVALYDQFFITVESALASKPSSTLVFSGQFAARLAGEVKLLLGSAPDTPNKLGYVIGLHENSDALLVHAAELKSAADRGNLPTMKRHAEHLVNLLQGSKGPNYGDSDKNGIVEDPGDGYGFLTYAEQAVQHTQLVANAPDASPELKQRGTQIQSFAANVRKSSEQILADSLAVLAASNAASVSAQARETDTLAKAAVRGQGNDGGFQQLFFAAQELAGLALTPIQINVAAAQTLPTPTPTAAPTATLTAAPKTVTVLMQGFVYKDKSITVDKGTTVVWVNKDPAKHTITSESGSPLNSKDVKANEQFSFTFNDAGTFPYYCEFHGDKGGVDMAGTVVVK